MGKNHTIKFMATREQKERIVANAQNAGKSMSEYIRELALMPTPNIYSLVKNTNEIIKKIYEKTKEEISIG